MSEGTSPNTLSTLPSCEGDGSSRGTTPDDVVRILDHSMESLILSDSSEEGITSRDDLTVGLDGEVEDGAAINILGGDEGAEDTEDKEESRGEGKEANKKKRRISSKRARKISLTSSDRVVCKIAGVEVSL